MDEFVQKIALLVLAAYGPLNLRWLVEALTDDFIAYIHVDKKADLIPFADLFQDAKVRFVEDRVDVFWAGFSMVEASLKLMQAALSDKEVEISHLCLISDDALPLCHPRALASRLREGRNDWIETWEVPDTHLFQNRYRNFYYLDSKFSTPRWFLTEQRNFEQDDFSNIVALMELKRRGKVVLKNLYAGKQWWALTSTSSVAILDFHFNNKHFEESFRYSAVADETYFQTIYNILFGSRTKSSNPMLDDFSREPKPFEFSKPSQFASVKDLLEKKDSFLFVRKTRFLTKDDFIEFCDLMWTKR